MVWSQYVYEATTGFDSYVSDEEEFNDDTHLNIEDWEITYSDELGTMWDMIRTLLHDAQIEHTGEFCDFVEFCYWQHDSDQERVTWEYEEQTMWYEQRLAHIWTGIRRVIDNNHLHEEMMHGATFHDFVNFSKNYMSIY